MKKIKIGCLILFFIVGYIAITQYNAYGFKTEKFELYIKSSKLTPNAYRIELDTEGKLEVSCGGKTKQYGENYLVNRKSVAEFYIKRGEYREIKNKLKGVITKLEPYVEEVPTEVDNIFLLKFKGKDYYCNTTMVGNDVENVTQELQNCIIYIRDKHLEEL